MNIDKLIAEYRDILDNGNSKELDSKVLIKEFIGTLKLIKNNEIDAKIIIEYSELKGKFSQRFKDCILKEGEIKDFIEKETEWKVNTIEIIKEENEVKVWFKGGGVREPLFMKFDGLDLL